jgi:hypothetical protein
VKIDVARRAVGAEVVYTSHPGAQGEPGRIVYVAPYPEQLVRVRYGGQEESKSTPVAKLEFLHVLGAPVRLHRVTSPSAATAACGKDKCTRRHDWLIKCSCGRKFWTGKLKYSRDKAEAHQRGQETGK